MPAPHVVQVETTLKGARRTFALQEKTLILGPNGSGKTAITQSIEAALTGKASKRGVGLLSREVDLMGLAGPDGFFTEVTLSTGEKASTEIAGSIKQAKRAQRAGPRAVVGALYETIFPATEIIAALDGSPESLRKAILSMVGPRITWAEIAAVMPQPLAAPGAKPPTAQERVKQAQALVTPYAKRPASQLPIDLLIAAREGASLRVKELGTLTKEAEQVASIVSAAADAQGAELRTLEEIDADVVKTEATQKALRAKRTELIDALAAELAKITAPPAKDDVLETAENLALFHAEKDATKCLVCGQSCERGHFAQQVKTLQGAAQGRAKRRSAYQAKCRAVQAAHDEKARAIDAKLTELEGRLRVLAGERGRVEAVAETQAGAAAEAGAKIATLRQQTNTVSELAAQLAQAVKDVLASAADAFAAALTRYYGAPIALELLAGEREVCRLGLKAGDSVFTEVSGSQWARLVGALVAVAMESASESEAPRIVVIPDRQFDAESLAAVLEALAAAPVQVFVQSVLRPAWVPQGWGVIELPRAS